MQAELLLSPLGGPFFELARCKCVLITCFGCVCMSIAPFIAATPAFSSEGSPALPCDTARDGDSRKDGAVDSAGGNFSRTLFALP